MCGVGGGDSTADMHDDKNMSPEKKNCFICYISLKTTLKTINRGKHLRVAHSIKILSFRDITFKSSKQLLQNQLS